jgi:hypothetical protein
VVHRNAGEDEVAGLVALSLQRPPIGGGDDFPIKRANLGSRGTLERRWSKLSARRFAGVQIWWAALREEEEEVKDAVKEWESYRAWGYL